MKKIAFVFVILLGMVSTPVMAFTQGSMTNAILIPENYYTKATPFTNILSVVPDEEVTLQVFNFPADRDFIVTMGEIGTRGIEGYVVGVQYSGEGGSFIVTYPIPSALKGSDYIAIRLENTSSGYFAYDFFKNVEGYGSTHTSSSDSADWKLAPGTYPLTSIVSVDAGESVTVEVTNATRNDAYTVRMGAWGTRGVGGIVVDTYYTEDSGTFTATFSIPESLKAAAIIAIRFESVNAPYYAYDWFYNK